MVYGKIKIKKKKIDWNKKEKEKEKGSTLLKGFDMLFQSEVLVITSVMCNV